MHARRPCRAPRDTSSSIEHRGDPLRERLGPLGLSVDGRDAVPAGRHHRLSARREGPGRPRGRRPHPAPDSPRQGARRRSGQGRPRLLADLLEHRLDASPAAAHPGDPLRPGPPGAGELPDRVPHQLAMVVPAQPLRRPDPRRPPRKLRPVVQVIDDWVTNRKLGLIFEARVGSGKLLVCSIDLEQRPGGEPRRAAAAREPAPLHGWRAVRPESGIDGRPGTVADGTGLEWECVSLGLRSSRTFHVTTEDPAHARPATVPRRRRTLVPRVRNPSLASTWDGSGPSAWSRRWGGCSSATTGS